MNTDDVSEIECLPAALDLVSEELSPVELFDYGVPPEDYIGRDPDLWLYRRRTIAMLKQYFRYSVEVGRLPSILGRELFRARVTAYKMASFEDAVIFVHDVESALERLAHSHQQLIATIIFQDYSHEQAAEMLGRQRRQVSREFSDSLDILSEIFLEGGLINRLGTQPVENTCQEGERPDFMLSDCKQAE